MMYAIVDIAGQQIKVEKDQRIFVHLLEGDPGAPVHFNRVLLIDNEKNILIGNPLLSDALITGKIISHIRGDKLKIFKKKRRKGYKVLKGHRQYYTEVHIEEILEKGGSNILKELVSKIEAKKAKKTEKTEKPKTASKQVPEEIKPSSVTDTETKTEADVNVKKTAEQSELKPKKSQVKTTKPKSSPKGKAPVKKEKKTIQAAADKISTGKTAKKKTSGTKKPPATKKTDKKE